MLGPDDLVLCAGTVSQARFAERVVAAAEAGFRGISLFLSDYEQAHADGLSDADMRAMLADHGLEVSELDPLMSWLPGAALGSSANQQGEAFFRHGESDFHAAAEALGARSINAVLVSDTAPPFPEIAEAFAGVCDRAAEHGLVVHLEFLPWTPIRDVQAALEIVEMADRPNGGVMLDSWHHFRSGTGDDALRRVPGARILGVQLNDAPRKPEPDVIAETTRRRLLPGEGDIDLVELVRILDEVGSRAPIGVEVFSEELFARPAAEVARRAGDAAREVLKRARSAA